PKESPLNVPTAAALVITSPLLASSSDKPAAMPVAIPVPKPAVKSPRPANVALSANTVELKPVARPARGQQMNDGGNASSSSSANVATPAPAAIPAPAPAPAPAAIHHAVAAALSTGASTPVGTAPDAVVFPRPVSIASASVLSSVSSPSAGYAASTGSPRSARHEPSSAGGSVHLSAPSTANMAVPSPAVVLDKSLYQEPKEQTSYIQAMPADNRSRLSELPPVKIAASSGSASGSGARASGSDDPDQMYLIAEARSSFNPAYQQYPIMEASTAHINPIAPISPRAIEPLELSSPNRSSPYRQAPRPLNIWT
ncbi:hypothetical protein BC831DRAFT_491581, partial [Entophlyctis helioformis]